MKRAVLTIPEVGIIAATRGMLGAGIGLLIADRLGDRKRRRIGTTLAIIGALTTIPLAMHVLSKRR